ncbi:hypothetical protein [Cellvibrio sp. NN19]|uniref:hypothetical protein n=1 Tax=Cellvibrio chitinivorans TaxID=3102792 RepID=UPI002B40ABDF|nr:hypothetical protein [Cellvibrio sp. NN19]
MGLNGGFLLRMKKMKTREWLFTIAIIILIQFIVQVGALIYSSDNNVLNYISFAGTIISIILATIAIVYSFVQTISQQSASSNISNQVDKLMSIVGQIDSSKKILVDSLEHLNNVSQKLDTSIEHQSKISSQVENLSKNITSPDYEKLSTLFNSELMQKLNTEKPENTNEIHEKILTNGYNGTQFMSLSLYYGEKNKLTLNETFEKITTAVIHNHVEASDTTELLIQNQAGMFLGVWQILAALDLVRITDRKKGTFTLSQNFANEIDTFIEFISSDTSEDEDLKFTKDIIKTLKSIEYN